MNCNGTSLDLSDSTDPIYIIILYVYTAAANYIQFSVGTMSTLKVKTHRNTLQCSMNMCSYIYGLFYTMMVIFHGYKIVMYNIITVGNGSFHMQGCAATTVDVFSTHTPNLLAVSCHCMFLEIFLHRKFSYNK